MYYVLHLTIYLTIIIVYNTSEIIYYLLYYNVFQNLMHFLYDYIGFLIHTLFFFVPRIFYERYFIKYIILYI